MNLLSKRFIGVTAALMIGSAPAWADELQEAALSGQSAAQLRQLVVYGSQPQRLQQEQQPLRTVRNSVAVLVRVPKDSAGRELKDQAQIKVRLRGMVKSDQKQSIQRVWNSESVPVFASKTFAREAATDDSQMNNEQWGRGFGWGGGFRPGFGWGGGFRPGWGAGFRPGWGWGGGFRPGFGWGGGFRPWAPWGWNAGFRPGFWPGVYPWGWNGFVPRPFFGVPTGFYGFNAPIVYPYPTFNYYYYPAAGFFSGCC